MLYSTGVLVPDPFIFISIKNKSYVLANKLEYSRIKKETKKPISVILQDKYVEKARSKFKRINLAAIAAIFLKEKGIKSVFVPSSFPLEYEQILSKNKITSRILDPFIDRSVKTPNEIKEIEKVQRVVEKAFYHAQNIIKKSINKSGYLYYNKAKLTSEFIKKEIEMVFLNFGMESPEGLIVSSGKDTALPHSSGSGHIKPNTPIVIDLYPRARKSMYYSDMTRTICKGQPNNKILEKMYKIVFEAQKAGYSKIKPGIPAEEVHKAVVSVFKKYNMEKYFIHSTGHGVGLDLHESPSVPGKTKLKANMVITNEPGLYIPNIGGIRIEDILVVTKTGYKTLTKLPKQFVI